MNWWQRIIEFFKKLFGGGADPMPSKFTNEEERRQYYINLWPRARIIYNAQHDRPRDVRTFIFDKSYILEDVVNKYNLRGRNDTDTMYKILSFVMDHLVYTSDEVTKKQAEYWQNPEDTITLMKGDCEDGAILIKSLSLVAGVPDWKVKICAGHVKGGGHAYAVYVRDNDTQCILDWCYWTNRLPIDDRPKISEESNYYDIWFSFTREHTFGEVDRKYGPNS